eukprot:Skav229222  [mRNA]  locus=scaffold2439:175179:187469:+ [translate_table: standard]
MFPTPREDQFFQKASEFARLRGLPRIYVSCNSGARVGLVEELKPLFKARVKWLDPSDCNKGFEYLYLLKQDPVDYEKLPAGTVEAHKVSENGEDRLRTVATEVSSPMILTGYGALNKLLGKNVYSSQDQLGGPQIMVPNGVTHQVVRDDQEGMSAILDWLSFVPKDISSPPPMCQIASDPWDRDVEFEPSPYPYDPRDFLRGVVDYEGRRMRGFFDAGSWSEYLEGWGQTVIVGRARLGGIPMGVIAVETRSVDRWVPADPSNPESSEVKETMGGKVWFPDSAFKTVAWQAQALKDFNRGENLPVMIFANWRGFSGGTRDMYNEILKFGAMIVDALVDYQHPIFIYIPKHGELRGGAWVVIDPAINPDKMETGEMYADVDARGGILEPPGIVEVKYRTHQQALICGMRVWLDEGFKVEAMHRIDDKLQKLDGQLESASGEEKLSVEKDIKAAASEFGSEQIITFVAMATPDDLNANAEFIRLADTFVEVPGGKNVNNYANVDLICRIAKEQQAGDSGTESVHKDEQGLRRLLKSTRFQKIFEEGPPTIAKKEVFHEMERAAMRLTALVGYRGARDATT